MGTSKITKQQFNKQSEELVSIQRFMEMSAPDIFTAGPVRYDKKLNEWGIQVFLKGTDKNIQVMGSIEQIRNTCYKIITDAND